MQTSLNSVLELHFRKLNPHRVRVNYHGLLSLLLVGFLLGCFRHHDKCRTSHFRGRITDCSTGDKKRVRDGEDGQADYKKRQH